MTFKGFLIRTDGRCEECTINKETELADLYAALECDMIDITCRKIGGKFYDVVCDDEGLLKDAPVLTAVTKTGEPMLCGNLLIANHEGPELTSLTDEDIKRIKRQIVYPAWPTATVAPRLLLCEYC